MSTGSSRPPNKRPTGGRGLGATAIAGQAPRRGLGLVTVPVATANRPTIKYFTTFTNTIYDVLTNRGWKEVRSESDWDIVWADREWVYACFDKMHLEPWQRLNHFRNGRELCRKDLMAKNIKRQRRTLEKENRFEEASQYDFIPTTFVLPREYAMFVEEFKKSGGIWIMKPIGSAQGKGIFLFTRLSEISEWRPDLVQRGGGGKACRAAAEGAEERDIEAYVVQRYIQYPFLIGGKKFDMRLYCLVTSFSPLKVYQYRRGFSRFTNSRYSADVDDIYNGFMHLTNVAIQKTAENYDERTGGKLELQALKLYLATRFGMERVDALFWEIQMIMLRSLLAVQPIMISDRHCFEMYGYDIIIDQDLKPWLLEVNASPSLTANTREDYLMKTEMLHGMLDVVDMEQQLNGDEEHVSGWDLVYDDGFIEINREKCGYSTFLGTAIPESSSGPKRSPHHRRPTGGAGSVSAEGGSEDEADNRFRRDEGEAASDVDDK